MKEKLIEFFQNKKELIVFIGLLSVTFIAVIMIANVTLIPEDDDVVVTPDGEDEDDDVVSPDEDKEEITYNFVLPFTGDKVVVRDFYNSQTPGENEDAIVETNGVYSQSKGTSYANEDNSTFDVLVVYPGTVSSIVEDDVLGTTITVDHGDNLYSVYSSLATINVAKGDKLEANAVIATAGTTTFDIKAGVHVLVEVISIEDNISTYIDIEEIVGKTFDDIVSSIK